MAAVLIQKLASMFIMLFAGFLVVKLKLLRPEDSKVLSTLTLYLISPCIWMSSFQIEVSHDNLGRFLLAVVNALIIHVVLVLFAEAMKKPLRLQPVERGSLVFTNCANLLIPVIITLLGEEWVVYGMAFMIPAIPLMWTYGKAILTGTKDFRARDLVNVNTVFMAVGMVFFLTGLRPPALLNSAIKSIADLVGPISMMVTGMLLAGLPWETLKRYGGLWKTALLRLLVLPGIIVLIFRLMPSPSWAPGAENIYLVSLLAACAPTASSITMMAQLYGGDEKYAGVINLVTTLLCILTMPLMVYLYQI